MLGTYDPQAPETAPAAVPRGWPVEVTLSGVRCGATASFSLQPATRVAGCRYRVEFPQRGAQALTVRVGGASATHAVEVKGWTVVAIGDSVASGEGNPQ